MHGESLTHGRFGYINDIILKAKVNLSNKIGRVRQEQKNARGDFKLLVRLIFMYGWKHAE